MQANPVTKLTNWERLNNAPLPLTGVSAVPWNDYIFVLPYTGMPLLYHTKSNIWSLLPQSPYTNSNTVPPALTSYNGQILTMSKIGKMATFDPQFGRWTELNDMNINLQAEYNCVLASYNSNLYAIVVLADQTATQGLGLQLGGSVVGQSRETENSCTIYSYNRESKWTKVCGFGQNPLQSAAIVNGTAFVHTGGEMYKMFLEKAANQQLDQKLFRQPSGLQFRGTGGLQFRGTGGLQFSTSQELLLPNNTPTKIASPPYKGCTLHAIKNTLFSFGGRDRDNQPTSDVLRYNPDTDTWESAGYMRSARYNVAVTTIQDTTLDVLVLGGSFGSSQYTMRQQAITTPGNAAFVGLGNFSGRNTPHWDNMTSILEKCTVN